MDGVNVPDFNNRGAGAIIDHIDIWTFAIQAKSASGRGSGKKLELYGIKKLRELILELAVYGKLTKGHYFNGSSKEVLQTAADEKAALAKTKKIREDKEVYQTGKLSSFPSNWDMTCIGQIAHVLGGKRVPKGFKLSEKKTDYVYLRVTDMKNQTIDESDLRYISKDVFEQISRYTINTDDVYVTIAGTIGAVGAIPPHLDGMSLTENAAKLVFRGISKEYIIVILQSAFVRNQFDEAVNQMAQPKLSLNSIKHTLIPVPSIQEQKCIVAKVEELMALCDQLEQQTDASIEAHQQLVTVLLDSLINSASADDFMANWARISDHFDTLFTTEASIDALKQTILQLAVMGKLVPQDPNDEPAAKLLGRIAAEKARLVKEKKIKKDKPLPAITDDEKPFPLPKGWEWCRLAQLELSSEAGWSPKCLDASREGEQWGVLKVSAVTWDHYNPLENKALPTSLEPKEALEVQDGDFLISRANTADLVAKAVVVPSDSPRKLMMSDKIIRFRFSSAVCSQYINLFNNSKFARIYYSAVAGGTSSSMKNVSRDQIRSLMIALPPYDEQLSILSTIQMLSKSCDQLKQRLSDSQQTQLKLTDALVDGALA